MSPRAIVLAAGIGSRLHPLTDSTPKALLKFRGITMLEHVIGQLKRNGVNDIIINLHHFADQIQQFIQANSNFGLNIQFSDERERLMDTGGGILKARWFLESGNPFIVHNIDIFTNLDLQKMMKFHLQHDPLATLAVKKRQTSRNLMFDREGQLHGWKNNQTGEVILKTKAVDLDAYAFSGIHIISPSFFDLITIKEPFSMTTAYLDLASSQKIIGYDHSRDEWIDMAHPDNFSNMDQ